MATHPDRHPNAGSTSLVDIGNGVQEYVIEDWWDRLTGGSWMYADGNPAAMIYGVRAGLAGLPFDDEVVYGKIGGMGHLVHTSELT